MYKEYTLTKTRERGGTISSPEALFPYEDRRVFLQINVIGPGALYCSIGDAPLAHVGTGIYIDESHPLCLQMPVAGMVWVVPDLTGIYTSVSASADASAGASASASAAPAPAPGDETVLEYISVTYSAAEGLC